MVFPMDFPKKVIAEVVFDGDKKGRGYFFRIKPEFSERANIGTLVQCETRNGLKTGRIRRLYTQLDFLGETGQNPGFIKRWVVSMTVN